MKETAIQRARRIAVHGFAIEIGDPGMTRITDPERIESAFAMYMACYPQFADAWRAKDGSS